MEDKEEGHLRHRPPSVLDEDGVYMQLEPEPAPMTYVRFEEYKMKGPEDLDFVDRLMDTKWGRKFSQWADDDRNRAKIHVCLKWAVAAIIACSAFVFLYYCIESLPADRQVPLDKPTIRAYIFNDTVRLEPYGSTRHFTSTHKSSRRAHSLEKSHMRFELVSNITDRLYLDLNYLFKFQEKKLQEHDDLTLFVCASMFLGKNYTSPCACSVMLGGGLEHVMEAHVISFSDKAVKIQEAFPLAESDAKIRTVPAQMEWEYYQYQNGSLHYKRATAAGEDIVTILHMIDFAHCIFVNDP
jgi:hypothetical protein